MPRLQHSVCQQRYEEDVMTVGRASEQISLYSQLTGEDEDDDGAAALPHKRRMHARQAESIRSPQQPPAVSQPERRQRQQQLRQQQQQPPLHEPTPPADADCYRGQHWDHKSEYMGTSRAPVPVSFTSKCRGGDFRATSAGACVAALAPPLPC